MGAKRIAAQAEIFLTSSFCRLETSLSALVSSVRLTLRMFCEQLAEPVGLLLHAQRVVLDVAQVAALLLVDARRGHQAARASGRAAWSARWKAITSRVSS